MINGRRKAPQNGIPDILDGQYATDYFMKYVRSSSQFSIIRWVTATRPQALVHLPR